RGTEGREGGDQGIAGRPRCRSVTGAETTGSAARSRGPGPFDHGHRTHVRRGSTLACAGVEQPRRTRARSSPLMQHVITGKAFVLGDNVDTDQIIPAQYLTYNPAIPAEYRMFGKYALASVPAAQMGLPKGHVPFHTDDEF